MLRSISIDSLHIRFKIRDIITNLSTMNSADNRKTVSLHAVDVNFVKAECFVLSGIWIRCLSSVKHVHPRFKFLRFSLGFPLFRNFTHFYIYRESFYCPLPEHDNIVMCHSYFIHGNLFAKWHVKPSWYQIYLCHLHSG